MLSGTDAGPAALWPHESLDLVEEERSAPLIRLPTQTRFTPTPPRDFGVPDAQHLVEGFGFRGPGLGSCGSGKVVPELPGCSSDLKVVPLRAKMGSQGPPNELSKTQDRVSGDPRSSPGAKTGSPGTNGMFRSRVRGSSGFGGGWGPGVTVVF